jgi:hypothetical protein
MTSDAIYWPDAILAKKAGFVHPWKPHKSAETTEFKKSGNKIRGSRIWPARNCRNSAFHPSDPGFETNRLSRTLDVNCHKHQRLLKYTWNPSLA